MASTRRCKFLEDLPPELRLRIYEYLFDEQYHSSLLIRSDSKVELISLAKAHGALLKTCRMIYREAASVLYSKTTFRVQIYPAEGYSSYGNVSRLKRSSPFLRQVQHLDVKSCIISPSDVGPALRLMKTFANAVEEVGATIKTLNVRSKLFPDVSKRRLDEYQKTMLQVDKKPKVDLEMRPLFQRMLEGADISLP